MGKPLRMQSATAEPLADFRGTSDESELTLRTLRSGVNVEAGFTWLIDLYKLIRVLLLIIEFQIYLFSAGLSTC